MNIAKSFALIVFLAIILLLNSEKSTAQEKFELKLNPKKDPHASALKLEKSSRPRFPFLIGAEFGRYLHIGNSDNAFNGLTFFLAINIADHSWFLKLDYGKLYREGEPNSNLLMAGLMITPLKERRHKIYLNFGAGVAMGKSGGGLFLSAEPKYLYAVTDFLGLSAGVKYFFTGSHILGICLGFQIFEN